MDWTKSVIKETYCNCQETQGLELYTVLINDVQRMLSILIYIIFFFFLMLYTLLALSFMALKCLRSLYNEWLHVFAIF